MFIATAAIQVALHRSTMCSAIRLRWSRKILDGSTINIWSLRDLNTKQHTDTPRVFLVLPNNKHKMIFCNFPC